MTDTAAFQQILGFLILLVLVPSFAAALLSAGAAIWMVLIMGTNLWTGERDE